MNFYNDCVCISFSGENLESYIYALSLPQGSSMRTKQLCVLIYIRAKGDIGAFKHVKNLQYFFIEDGASFVDPVSCLSLLCCCIYSLQPCGHLL